MKLIIFIICFAVCKSDQYNILAIFPYNGRSHHIFFSTIVEELAKRHHEVTVVNYFPLNKFSNLRQISLQKDANESDMVNIEEHLKNSPNVFTNFYKAYNSAQAFKYIANINCKRLVTNEDVQAILSSKIDYDLVIVEQFVTDCGLAIAHKLNAPVVGMTAHVLMPWTYSRLGVINNPAYVPNHFFGTGSKPNLWNKIQSFIINFYLNVYYSWIIQSTDQEIINEVFLDVPNLESLGENISLIMLNQYFPLTGSRLYGANVIEIGGMHIKQENKTIDKELNSFLDKTETDVIFISFGTVATRFPSKVINEIRKLIIKWSNMTFIWKAERIPEWSMPAHVFVREWLPQLPILCHPKVKAFVTHSGMLSSSEAMHCGKPVVSVPLFGDQFANAASAVENGLGVTLDIMALNEFTLAEAISMIMNETYQWRAKRLSEVWRDRPLSPMNTAVYWIEYVAKHKGTIQMKPATVNLPMYQYLLIDVYLLLLLTVTILMYLTLQLIKKLGQLRVMETKIKRD